MGDVEGGLGLVSRWSSMRADVEDGRFVDASSTYHRDGGQGEGRSLRADSRNEVDSALSTAEMGAGQDEGVTMVVSAAAETFTAWCG
jgi:hypothetical protein